ncbi:valine--tRNA ligase [Oribacterium sp. P9]|uniref:valine--tRNA ligase n=1 Tax=unclassified Oribacterium TaxID=2629782 RepID=UPI002A7BAB3E|nr:valine--tRNA ligase [Oribacterium sp.]MDD6520368.1 valine--tRNA ligase [Oribacterium sp.]MDY2854017.1 valine--tRNA ligase [Oliverpabstia sp.]MEE1377513.1 valine--tRNA ligase [Oribacterium sp.]
MKELAKQYNPEEVEDRIYDMWLKGHYFHAEVNPNKKPFTIMMPPPNVTGQLHMGHALDNTLQDSLIRWKRMQGYEALWQPGSDHAAIATEVKVTNQLKERGIDKHALGREGFLKEAWKWKEEYESRIVNQLHKIGSSADWDRLRFTMDEGCTHAVQTTFINLYKKGYIYKGSRIINWCPVCHTSLSDAEVNHEEQEGHFWHILYPLADGSGQIEIATTRPETLLGDTAVAVNPEDPRYKDMIGKMVKLPLTDREIPIVGDEHADMTFGTGAVKITPAHDPNDFEVGKRHNLPEITILNDDATIHCPGSKYDGMDRYEARKAMVQDLTDLGLLVKVVPTKHNVGTHDRCGTTVEPMIKPQWFVRMEEMAKPAIKAIETGELQFVPENYSKTYLHWLENIKDWCISRQLWWGHRIPAYYCEDCGEMVVGTEAPESCPKCGGHHFRQDEDTLDTWFSSALWPFETLGWPEDTPEYRYFYPTDVLVTGYDIIFFWVVRMVFSGLEQTGKVPFHKVLIHGLVRDDQGRKMSKSLGNGIDPLEVIRKYGADALRMTLLTGNAPGNDMRFYWSRVEASRNFMNKVWNASRFIMMNLDKADLPETMPANLTMADKWILSKVNSLAADVTRNLEAFDLGIALDKVQNFIWEEFCDWYIEMVKPRLWNEEDETKAAALWTLKHVLITSLKLLHPFCPFITEEIFDTLENPETPLMCQSWPEFSETLNFQEDEAEIETIKEAVRSIRNVRTNMNVAPSRKAMTYVVTENERVRKTFEHSKVFFATLAYASDVIIQSDKTGIADDAVTVAIPDAVIHIPFADLVDIAKEIERLEKEKQKWEAEIRRSTGMLNNERFTSKAPAEKVEEEREKLQRNTQLLQQVTERLAALRK